MIILPTNLNHAYKQVKSNKGNRGVDGLGVEDLLYYLCTHERWFISGYGFCINTGKGLLRVQSQSITKMKEIKELVAAMAGVTKGEKKHLDKYISGCVNYFKLANMKDLLIVIDKWFSRRLRMGIWKQWKKTKTRFQNLMNLGISRFQAMMFSNKRKGYWRTAQSPILQTSIMNRLVGYLLSQLIFVLFACKLRNRCMPNGTYDVWEGSEWINRSLPSLFLYRNFYRTTFFFILNACDIIYNCHIR